jgi:putative membrane-bound dehydrogenase-like protein
MFTKRTLPKDQSVPAPSLLRTGTCLAAALLVGLAVSCRTTPAAEEVREEVLQRGPDPAVAGLKVIPGLEARLFASDPTILKPTNIDVDARGRVWVAEGTNYRIKLNPQNPVREEGDRIVILEDTNGDGVADKHTVFYQGQDINSALGIWVMGNKAIVSRSPNVFIFTDTDGDDVADKKELLFTGISGEEHDHGMHSFTFGPDGKLYFNFGNEGQQLRDRDGNPIKDQAGNEINHTGNPYRQGMVFRCNPDGSEVEVLAHNFRNNFEVAVDSYGALWQSDNDDDGNRAVRINYVMPYGNYGFHDEMTGAGWSASRTNLEKEIPLRHWHLNDPGVVPNLLQTGAGSPTGIIVYEGSTLPEQFRGQIIHCDAGPNVVRSYPTQPDGAGYKAEIVNIVEGVDDKLFRPSDVCVAPDGSLIISDWYDPGVGGHQMAGVNKGRIFRVAPPGKPYRVPQQDLSTPAGAVKALQSPNLSTRYQAWQKLHAWGPKAEDALLALWKGEDPRFRARALWLLTKIEGRGKHYVDLALQDQNPNIRMAGLRAAYELKMEMAPLVKTLVRDANPQVRREAVIMLRYDRSQEAPQLWAELANQHDGKDRWYLEALGIGADLQWDRFMAAWLKTNPDLSSSAGRDIVWRSRGKDALPLLAKLATDSATPEQERLRYFRAFDFHKDASKQDVLLSMLGTGDPKTTGLALQAIDAKNVKMTPELKKALDQALQSSKGSRQFVDLVARYSMSDKNPELLKMALAMPDSSLGVEAAKLLLQQNGTDLIRKSLYSKNDQIAIAMAKAIGSYENKQVHDLLETVVTDQKRSLEVRKEALRKMGRGWGGEEKLVAVLKAGKLPKDLEPTAANMLVRAGRANIREAASQYLKVPSGENKALPAIGELVSRTGDVASGKAVFSQTCIACHRVNGEGLWFGPDLSEIGSKLTKEALYNAIIHPDAGISFGYEGYTFRLRDGSQVTGIIASETADKVEVRLPGGTVNSYNKSDITSRKQLDQSLMPTGLQQTMTEQQLVGLVEYLASLQRQGKAQN